MKNNYRIENDKCYIILTQGKECVIDVEDMDLVGQYRWCAHKNLNVYYVLTRISNPLKTPRQKTIKIHRLIMGLKEGDKRQVDHRDRNGLNNCKSNLRLSNHQQNAMNKKSHRNSSSKYKGVSWDKIKNKWHTSIKHHGKTIHLGDFILEIEAAKAYDTKAKDLFKEFANLNFKED